MPDAATTSSFTNKVTHHAVCPSWYGEVTAMFHSPVATNTPKVGQATVSIARVQAQAGIIEQRVATASDRLQMQIDIFRGKVSDLVEIDPYEASTRVSNLLSQIETAYTLTSRLRQLSLVNYL